MKYRDTWKAAWEDDTLHISGKTDLFPNEFSTSSLEKIDDLGLLAYRIAFYRDKEPFCDSDLVGEVHYFETNFPSNIHTVRIYALGEDYVEISVPKNT